MAERRVFKLMVPSGYGPDLTVTGRIGPTPDTSLIDNIGRCARSRLPAFIDDLVFTFPRAPPSFPETRQNFYLLRDFFVVSSEMKRFMLSYLSGQDIEVRKVRVHHDDGRPATEPYYALKIVSAIDCVDPELSTISSQGPTGAQPFTDRTLVYELNPSLAAEFANKDGTHYFSYPETWMGVQTVQLKEPSIPSKAVLFQPACWPGYRIIEAEFARLLASRCSGGFTGYYFWALDLASVQTSLGEMMRALR